MEVPGRLTMYSWWQIRLRLDQYSCSSCAGCFGAQSREEGSKQLKHAWHSGCICCTKLLTKRIAQVLLPVADPEAVIARRVKAVLVLCSKAAQSGGEGVDIVREVSCKFSIGS